MKKQILAAAVAAAFIGAPLAASAETTLYGQFTYELGAVENADGDRVANQSYRGTRIGVRGGEDLGGGLRAMFQIQGAVAPNSGWAANEEVNVGLSGGFGQLRLGQSDTAFKLANNRFRVFTDMLPEASVADQGANNFIPRNNARAQGIHYRSPSFGGFSVNATLAGGSLTGSAGNVAPGIGNNPTGKSTYGALSLLGNLGPVMLSAGLEAIDPEGGDNRNNFSVGASYSGGGLMGGLLFQSIENANGDDDFTYTLPITYRMGNIGLRAAIQYTDPDQGNDATDFALGASYFLSRRTQAMANLWSTNDTDATHFSVGVRHSF